MKKPLIILAACVVLFSSCAVYSCPTYAEHTPAEKEKNEERLQYYR